MSITREDDISGIISFKKLEGDIPLLILLIKQTNILFRSFRLFFLSCSQTVDQIHGKQYSGHAEPAISFAVKWQHTGQQCGKPCCIHGIYYANDSRSANNAGIYKPIIFP